ncbi:MAG TPA: M64 family metallopeptidase [Vicinamibacteria bacterium]|nr:M64 family metallopeptidase [Vicinamibacteria bacterium]
MSCTLLLAAALGSAPSLALPAVPRTLRLELVHAGDATQEHFAYAGLVREGEWPGNPARPIDDTNLGRYLLEVRDAASSRLLYSRGFASIYGEWETTDEAKQRWRAFPESLRFPEPSGPVQVAIRERGRDGLFREVWTLAVDPGDPAIDRSPSTGKAWAVMENGPPAEKVDLVLLGDGYTEAEMEKWHRDARRLTEILFSTSPFKERRGDFNVWAVDTPSPESGVSRPSEGVYRRSALRASYDAFGSERYVLSFDDERVREAAAAAPYDVMEIVVNGRKYGGGGIFNLYATVASDNAFTPYVFVHEFGHHFAGLADEYYTSDVAYGPASPERPEPWEPNATASATRPKWKDLVTSGTALPTPWSKEAFEAAQEEIQARRRKIRAEKRPEEEMEALFREEQQRMDALLAQGPYARSVGAFEGALYEAKGYYRAQANCIMFTRHTEFCAACRRAIERIIELYTGR